jgi:hypothetical protein
VSVELLRQVRDWVLKTEPTLLGFVYPSIGVDVLELCQRATAAATFEALYYLDAVAPGGSFQIWVDGGRFDEETGWSYHFDRPKAQVLAVIGKAILRAEHPRAEDHDLLHAVQTHGSNTT